MELSELPLGLNETESVQRAIQVYCHSIATIRSVPVPSDATEDLVFTEAIRKTKANGVNLVPLVCSGLKELENTDLGKSALRLDSVQEDLKQRLDTFFLARIGIRMLIGQHVESLHKPGGRVELVNVKETVERACERAAQLCHMYLGVKIEYEIRCGTNVNAPFVYVESHLHHMVFELVKNAMHATVRYHHDLQRKEPRELNQLDQQMDPNSRALGFVIPRVSMM